MVRLLFVFVFLIGLFIAPAQAGKTIDYDLGGPIGERIREMKNLDGVRIEGYCASACTLYLKLKNTCVTKNARLGFHGPLGKDGKPLDFVSWNIVTNLMADHYPPKLKKWFLEKGRFVSGRSIYIISGKRLIAMGVKECK